jgi:hypothetical protein
MLTLPLDIGKVRVMVINPTFGTISMLLKGEEGKCDLDYNMRAQAAAKYMEDEGLVQKRTKKDWQLNIGVIH